MPLGLWAECILENSLPGDSGLTVPTPTPQQPPESHSLWREPLDRPGARLPESGPLSSPQTSDSLAGPRSQEPQRAVGHGCSGFLSVVEEGRCVCIQIVGGLRWVRGNKVMAAHTTPLGEPQQQLLHRPWGPHQKAGRCQLVVCGILQTLRRPALHLPSTPTHNWPQNGALILDSQRIPCALLSSLWK